MKAGRSSGHGMDFRKGKNGVPALSVGVRIRVDSLPVEQYRSFLCVLLVWTGFRRRENGKLLGAFQQLGVLSFLTGIMMASAIM